MSRKAPPKPQPTPASAWGAALYQLPSGRVARLRRPALSALIARGNLPNPIAAKLHRFLSDAASERGTSDAEKLDRYRANIDVLIEIAALAMVEPRLVLDREPQQEAGEIGALDMLDQDVIWIYYGLTLGTEDEVSPFRLA